MEGFRQMKHTTELSVSESHRAACGAHVPSAELVTRVQRWLAGLPLYDSSEWVMPSDIMQGRLAPITNERNQEAVERYVERQARKQTRITRSKAALGENSPTRQPVCYNDPRYLLRHGSVSQKHQKANIQERSATAFENFVGRQTKIRADASLDPHMPSSSRESGPSKQRDQLAGAEDNTQSNVPGQRLNPKPHQVTTLQEKLPDQRGFPRRKAIEIFKQRTALTSDRHENLQPRNLAQPSSTSLDAYPDNLRPKILASSITEIGETEVQSPRAQSAEVKYQQEKHVAVPFTLPGRTEASYAKFLGRLKKNNKKPPSTVPSRSSFKTVGKITKTRAEARVQAQAQKVSNISGTSSPKMAKTPAEAEAGPSTKNSQNHCKSGQAGSASGPSFCASRVSRPRTREGRRSRGNTSRIPKPVPRAGAITSARPRREGRRYPLFTKPKMPKCGAEEVTGEKNRNEIKEVSRAGPNDEFIIPKEVKLENVCSEQLSAEEPQECLISVESPNIVLASKHNTIISAWSGEFQRLESKLRAAFLEKTARFFVTPAGHDDETENGKTSSIDNNNNTGFEEEARDKHMKDEVENLECVDASCVDPIQNTDNQVRIEKNTTSNRYNTASFDNLGKSGSTLNKFEEKNPRNPIDVSSDSDSQGIDNLESERPDDKSSPLLEVTTRVPTREFLPLVIVRCNKPPNCKYEVQTIQRLKFETSRDRFGNPLCQKVQEKICQSFEAYEDAQGNRLRNSLYKITHSINSATNLSRRIHTTQNPNDSTNIFAKNAGQNELAILNLKMSPTKYADTQLPRATLEHKTKHEIVDVDQSTTIVQATGYKRRHLVILPVESEYALTEEEMTTFEEFLAGNNQQIAQSNGPVESECNDLCESCYHRKSVNCRPEDINEDASSYCGVECEHAETGVQLTDVHLGPGVHCVLGRLVNF